MHFSFDGVKEDSLTLGGYTNKLKWGRMRRRGKTMKVKIKTADSGITMDLDVGIKDVAKADEFIDKWKGVGVWV
jgi:hypothetical protein